MSADSARVTMRVNAPPERAFEAFTGEIARWWRRGPRFRNLSGDQGMIHIEAGPGGRIFESIRTDQGESAFEIGRITCWEPPHALGFGWRSINYAPDETTQVEILFAAAGTGTLVTVIHSGWSALPPDHPVRHGAAPGPFLREIGLWWAAQLRAVEDSILQSGQPPL